MRRKLVKCAAATSILLLLIVFPGAALGVGETGGQEPPVENTSAVPKDQVGEPEQPAIHPETTQPETTPVTLKPIVITTTRSTRSIFDSPVSLTVIDKTELLERSIRTPAEALRYKPGIWVQKTGHLGGAPILRGFMGNRVIYLFDGVRRNTAGLFKGPNSFLQNVDALDVDRIEVVRGPGSVLYGSDAIGGIVNVITNEEPLFSDSLKIGGRFYTRFASVDQETSTRAEIFLSSPKFYIFFGGTYRDIDDLRGGGGAGTQSPSGWRENNWDFQIDYKLAPGHRLEFFAQDFSRPYGRRFDRPNWRQDNRRKLYGLRYFGKDIGFIDDLEVTTYFHKQESFIDERFWDSDSVERTFGAEVQATSYVGDSVRLVYGAHYHQDNIRKSNPQGGTRDPDVDWRNAAVFGLSEWQATDRLRIDFGLRWDSFTLKSKTRGFARLEPAVQNAIRSGSFSLSSLRLNERDDALTGGLGMVYELTEHLNLVGHIGRAFRAPNKSDMLSASQFTFGFNVPSPGLEPESSWTYELGLKASYPDFAGALTGFYTVVEDAIVSKPGVFGGASFIDVNGNGLQDRDEQVFVNGNDGNDIIAYGTELEWNWYLPPRWTESLVAGNVVSTYGNATWIYGKESDEPLDRAFPANALFGIRVEDSRDAELRKWWAEFDVWIVDSFNRIPSRRQNRDSAFRRDPQNRNSPLLRGDGSIPGFTTFNIHSGFKLNENTTLTVGIENLTDKKFRVKDSRIDGPGINLVVGLEVRF